MSVMLSSHIHDVTLRCSVCDVFYILVLVSFVLPNVN